MSTKKQLGHSKTKTAVVAGGAGFIGSHLCTQLLSEGWKVRCIDNLYTGSMENISHLLDNSDFEFIQQDVADPYEANDVSLIFNLACPASPRHYQKDAIYTTRTAVIGTMNMLNLARKNDCVMLQASTSEVYGDPQVHPQPETYYGNVNTTGIRSCYDEGKRIGESLCMDSHRQYGTKVKIVRIFNTYGPQMAEDDGRVVSNFIIQALHNDSITVYGDGSQTRSFQYVSDLINGFRHAINTPDSFTGPVNIGNPEEFTINELADTVIRLTKSSSTIIYKTLPQNDPTRRKPDITLARTTLGWEPKVHLKEGLTKTIEFFSRKLGS